MELISQDIRYGQQCGDARIVWKEINGRGNSKSNTRKGNMVLKDIDGSAQRETHIYLGPMKLYIRHRSARMREIWDVECIPDEIWISAENIENYIQIGRYCQIQHKGY